MTIAPAIVAGVIIFGAVVLAAGMIGLIRDGRRLATPVYVTMGLGLLAIGVGLLLTNQGHPGPLIVVGITTMALFILGNVVGYPLLMIFLLYSGATVLRKESRSLGNALALLAGLGLLFLPTTLGILAPPETPRTDPAYMFRYATHLSVVLVVFYFGFVFAAFFAASLLYRWRRIRTAPEAVIVLGSGLIDGNVPPLLAARLDRGLSVQQQFHGEPVLIPSGGQGPDEPRPEGEAMRDYLVAQGADPATVTAETESRTTEENLVFSHRILDATGHQAPYIVTTSRYHAFRAALLARKLGFADEAIGGPTAFYFVPSATVREFLAILSYRKVWLTVLFLPSIAFVILLVRAALLNV